MTLAARENLSPAEQSRLAELEGVVERGLQTFVEVGIALAEIRDARLYRETNSTFEDYCRERWRFSRVHAHRTIEAAEVAAALPTGNRPENERQARELVPLLRDGGPEAVVALLRELHDEGDRITAARLKTAVEWAQWEGEWRDVTGEPAPTLDAFKRLLREPIELGGVVFAGLEEIDEEAAEDAHAAFVLEYAAGALLRTGRYPPPPPSLRDDSKRPDPLLRRMKWNLRVEHRAGRLLLIGDALNEQEPDRANGLTWARAQLDEPFASEWSDEDVRNWVRGVIASTGVAA